MTVIKEYNPNTGQWEPILVGKQGPVGNTGPAGPGVAQGGVTDDLLVKQSSTDYDTAWSDEITVDRVTWDVASGDSPQGDGEVTWDVDEGTLAIGMNDGVVGRAIEHSFYRVKADEAISKGDLCMAVGTVGNSGKILVAKARPSYGLLTDIPSQRLMGLAANTMANGDEGYVVHFGKLRQINTAVWNEGDILWADPTVPGGLTATRPAAGNWRTIIALVVTDSAQVGELFVRPTFGSDLGNDEQVELSSPAEGEALVFDGTAGVWENRVQWTAAQVTSTVGGSGDYIPLTVDAGKLLLVDSASNRNVTIDGSLDLAVGQRIDLVRMNTGEVTVVGSGATVNGTPGLRLRARYSAATLLCVGTDAYVLLGDLAA